MNTVFGSRAAPVPLKQVSITGGFWGERQSVNREVTIPAIYRKLEESGRIESWSMQGPAAPPEAHARIGVRVFWDSDSGKWLEAAAYSLATHPDAELEATADALIDAVEGAQRDDGYLNTYFPVHFPAGEWANLRDNHEMYNAGHLMEAAVAYHQATGKRKLLDVLARFSDHIAATFGAEEGKRRGYGGHPEIELALVKMFRETGEKRFLDLASYLIDERGQAPHYYDQEAYDRGDSPKDYWAQTYRYCQAHLPLREHTEANGHSVRACYLYAGIADVALETGDEDLLRLSRLLWDDLTRHQIYVHGGVGPSHHNEGFTFAYDMPTETAYCETCAAIALAFWAQRMFHLDPDSRYIDVMELAIYNSSLSGLSHSGDKFFYANPLAAYPGVNPQGRWHEAMEEGHHRRVPWFHCPCCPPNISRLIANIGEYAYSQAGDRVYVQMYHDNSVSLDIGGSEVRLAQETQYPWDGSVQITVHAAQPVSFELALRIPDWCYDYQLSVNGEPQTAAAERGYVILARDWSDGDRAELTLAMPVERVMPHPDIRQTAGQTALQRGPLVYCLEEVDNGPRLANVCIPQDSELDLSLDSELFGGVAVITGKALRIEPAEASSALYRHHSRASYAESEFIFKAIPYYLWANRDPGEMRVWIRSS
ncbi:MAG: glycoside hydrolase family 127 protein [Chloroflexota bacterium]|nr:glycoside hydrolase family 127 protein [Chloroflexota bacterium]